MPWKKSSSELMLEKIPCTEHFYPLVALICNGPILAPFPFQLTRRTSRETQHVFWLDNFDPTSQQNVAKRCFSFQFDSFTLQAKAEFSVCTCLSAAGYKIIFKVVKFGLLEILWSWKDNFVLKTLQAWSKHNFQTQAMDPLPSIKQLRIMMFCFLFHSVYNFVWIE